MGIIIKLCRSVKKKILREVEYVQLGMWKELCGWFDPKWISQLIKLLRLLVLFYLQLIKFEYLD